MVITGGDGQPDIRTRAFLRKLKDCLRVPMYALVDPNPKGLLIFCTFKFGSTYMPFDNVGLPVPDIKLIAVYLHDVLDLNDMSRLTPLTRNYRLILEGPYVKYYVISDEQLRENINFMVYRGLKSNMGALYHRHYPPTDYIHKTISNQKDI